MASGFILMSLIWLLLLILVPILLAQVLNLSRNVKDLKRRLEQLEGLSLGPVHLPSPGEPPPKPPPQPVQATAPIPAPSQPEPVKTVAALAKPKADLEAIIGGSLLNRVGVVAFVFGVAFFLKYAFDNRWIGETGRVILGLFAGLVFLGLGERYQRKDYPRFSQGLTGGGIALLYLSIYAAFGFYHLIPQVPAFGFMICVTAASVVLAVRYRALPIAILATLGGFLTPFLLSTGVDNQRVLFSYIFLLNLGVLGLAYFKNWQLLNYQSFILTAITFIAWMVRFYVPEKLWTTVFFLTLFFLVFAFLAILYNIIHSRSATAPELILAFLNAGLYFGAMYLLLEDKYHDYLGLFSLAMAGIYIGLSYFTHARHEKGRFLIWMFLGLAATFVTLAIPIQLKQNWVTIGWAVEGAILSYIAFRYRSWNVFLAAFAILALVFFRLIFFDVQLSRQFVQEEYVLLVNKRGLSFIVGIAAMLLAGYWSAKASLKSSTEARAAAGCLLIIANVLAIILLSVEAYDFLEYLRYQNRIPHAVSRHAQQLSLSIIWALYAAFLIVAGIWKGYKPIRYMALLLFSLTILKVFFLDLSGLERFYRIISFIALGIILIAVSFLYQKYKHVLIGPTATGGESE